MSNENIACCSRIKSCGYYDMSTVKYLPTTRRKRSDFIFSIASLTWKIRAQRSFENSSNIFQLSSGIFRNARIIFDIDARNSNLVWPGVFIPVSGLDPVPPRKSVPHTSRWTERSVQLDCNLPTGQWHHNAVQSVGVLWRTSQAERQTWSQFCGQQVEEGKLQCCRIAIDC